MKHQVFQIPEQCSQDSIAEGTGPLRKTYMLSPRKLKRTSGVSCPATVSKLDTVACTHTGSSSRPQWERRVFFLTPEVCSRVWREGIVTLPDLTTQSIKVGDSVLYDLVPQGIIRVDSQVTSCQGTQVGLGSQMVEKSLVLSQYWFEISEEEFIMKEDGEMEARISRVTLATSCQVTQGSCVSSEAIFLWTTTIYNLQIFIINKFYIHMLSIDYLDTQGPDYPFRNTS